MSHIHLPDGILPVRFWVLGWILLAGLLFVFKEQFEDGSGNPIPEPTSEKILKMLNS